MSRNLHEGAWAIVRRKRTELPAAETSVAPTAETQTETTAESSVSDSGSRSSL